MTNNDPATGNAVDTIRCVYLAHLLEQQGHSVAAQRWSEKADRWLNGLGYDEMSVESSKARRA